MNFRFNEDWYILALQSRDQSDKIVILKIEGDLINRYQIYDTELKIQRLALGNTLHHAGFSDDSYVHENSCYTGSQ